MKVIVPGSYDPETLGHVDIIRRAAEENEQVYAVIFVNPDKKYTFSLEDRVRMLILATDEFDNVMVSYSNGMVVDYMREHGIERIVKGYRNETDYAYEMKQAEFNMNYGGYETELKKCDANLADISSTAAREKIAKGESLEDILPTAVIEYISRM